MAAQAALRTTSQRSSRSLPPEIVSKIFIFGARPSQHSQDSINFPLLVSHVSRTWRRIAFATPGLWTAIILTGTAPPRQLMRSAAWLVRSQASPLHIRLDFRDPAWRGNEDEARHRFGWQRMEVVLRVLLPHLERWAVLNVRADTWAPLFALLWHTRGASAPALRTLTLVRCNTSFAARRASFAPAALRVPISLFAGSAPALQAVALVGVHVDWTAAAAPAGALAGLTALELRYHARDVMPSRAEFTALLAVSPRLRRLHIIGWGPRSLDDDGSPASAGAVPLTHLRELALGWVDAAYAADLLTLLALAPGRLRVLALEDVEHTLSSGQDLGQDASPVLTALANRGAALEHVTELHMRGVRAPPAAFAGLFGTLPALRVLTLDGTDGAVLAGLIMAPAQGREGDACPCLSRVSLRHVHEDVRREWERACGSAAAPGTGTQSESEARGGAHTYEYEWATSGSGP